MDEVKDKAIEAKSEKEDKVAKEFMWFQIRMVPKDTFEEFKLWCRKHAGNKMNVGLQMLLDIAKLSETTAALFEKIKEVEEKLDLLTNSENEKGMPTLPKTLGSHSAPEKEGDKDE
jgi:hypothetical protein